MNIKYKSLFLGGPLHRKKRVANGAIHVEYSRKKCFEFPPNENFYIPDKYEYRLMNICDACTGKSESVYVYTNSRLKPEVLWYNYNRRRMRFKMSYKLPEWELGAI
jgi:hypothetical protein